VCPIPEKAVVVEEIEITGEDGETLILQQPYVVRDLCIGCGICENKCPVEGTAAIIVRA
jgi:Pyruvate/2-oxoacid:ferredoxin oxidoreductase delta subunit